MANPFNIGIFSGPRYSSFPWSHDNKISMSAGKITPIAWEFLNTGDKIEADVANVVRLAPMVAPTLDTYRVDIHAFALRLRSLGNATRDPWKYEDFFNLNKNQDGSLSLPMIPLVFLLAVNGFKNGTLIESLGFPTFKKDRDSYLEFLRRSHSWVFDPVVNMTQVVNVVTGQATFLLGFYPASMPQLVDGDSPSPLINQVDYNDLAGVYSVGGNPYKTRYKNLRSGVSLDNGKHLAFRGTLISYIALNYPEVLSELEGDDEEVSADSFGAFKAQVFPDTENLPSWIEKLNGTNLLDKVYELYKIDSVSVMKDFEDWLLEGLLSLSISGNVVDDTYYRLTGYSDDSFFHLLVNAVARSFPGLPDVVVDAQGGTFKGIPSYPFDAYYKIISDWYINTALAEPDSFFASHSFNAAFEAAKVSGDFAAFRSQLSSLNELFKRFWANDYFTSAFPTPQAGQAVGIPVNGTIVDLRNANAMQKLKERLLYAGSRFRDVLFAITGKHTSSAILEMSEVLGSWSNIINVDSVLQQSESVNGSPQAGYAGTGLGYRAGGKDFRYTAEEPTIIMVFASIVPLASYFQGLSRKFVRANVYDYAIPQLANVGEQRIMRGELYVGSDSPSVADEDVQTFGYTRRNGDFMWTPSEVHGDFRGSLDYWHNARIFGSLPSLSQNFLQVNPTEDNLNRVFAVESDSYDHFYCNFSFTGHVIRSLPKHVHYDL